MAFTILPRTQHLATAIRHIGILAALLFGALFAPAAQAAPPDDADIAVDVEIVGDLVKITSSFHVEASLREAWAVITDYDHAAAFISDLEYSRIESYVDNTLYVHQKGRARVGPFSFPMESVSKILLTPFGRMETRLIRGTMKSSEGTTLITVDDAGTRITNHTESIPNIWIPPIVGRFFIAHEIRAKFGELRVEILRRKKDRKSTRLNSSHSDRSRMPSSA